MTYTPTRKIPGSESSPIDFSDCFSIFATMYVSLALLKLGDFHRGHMPRTSDQLTPLWREDTHPTAVIPCGLAWNG